ncbi:MAG: hypothetical protein RLZZ58_2283 [Pseudomonadota bacterium]|jgi:mRNA interferase MazF
MRRGDVVTIAAGSGIGSKPRPAVIIQADAYSDLPYVIVIMLTSDCANLPRTRPHVAPDEQNGLRQPSDLMADIPVAVRRDKIGAVIGTLASDDLARCEAALLVVLGFAG